MFIFEFEAMGFLGDAVVENLPAMQETQVQSWGRKDPLEKGMDRGAWWATVLGVTKSWTQLSF